ncbi:HD domain-containing protein [Candidatus Gottesmanbacteria bacterium]|nr:HD domain-containing protein [Candidatus Gottesmanbacteria bacterium]
MSTINLQTPEDALKLLNQLGAPPLLLQHHCLVAEAAAQIIDGLSPNLRQYVDARQVLIGAALHDVGKIVYPDEITGHGNRHEQTGYDLLIRNGVEPKLAIFCVTHAAWKQQNLTVEDLLVALADTLWKGKRIHELEELAIRHFAKLIDAEFWGIFLELDTVFQAVTERADERLGRSKAPYA